MYFINTKHMNMIEAPNQKQQKPRCALPECNKKLKLSDLQCRCEKRFCLNHRLPEQHICSLNYKNVNPIKLESCVREKVIRI